MALTFRKLEVFVAVAEDGNFRRAAERLGISQPSVSSQIKSTERYLGYQLFERRRGATSELSAEGRNFLQRARELVAAQSALAAEYGIAHQRQWKGIKPHHRVDAGNGRYRQAERNENRPGRGSRRQIAGQPRPPVGNQPFGKGFSPTHCRFSKRLQFAA